MATNGQNVGTYNASMDVNNPYFVNVSDMNSNSMVNPPLNGTNYHTWKRSMEILLGVKHKIGFIDGSLTCPSQNSALNATWKRCNLIVLSWILNSVVPEIAQSVLYIDTACKMWSVLEERYSQSNEPRIFELQQSIHSLHQGNSTVSAYFTKLESLWIDLNHLSPLPVCFCAAVTACSCSFLEKLNKREENYFRMIFLMGLNESFSAVRGQIFLMKPIPAINEVFQLVVQEEKQRSVGVQNREFTEQMAMAAKFQPRYPKKDTKFSYCHALGHMKDNCYKLHGYPPGWKTSVEP